MKRRAPRPTSDQSPATAEDVRLETPDRRRRDRFLEGARRSRRLHGRWIAAPATIEEFEAFLVRARRPNQLAWFVMTPADEIAGVINASEIVRGNFHSAYLGYYALAPHHRRGYMTAGLSLAIHEAFAVHGLHRLEANIQPENLASRRLVRRLGFRREGLSPRYLKIAGRWRDHERWAITREEWARARGGDPKRRRPAGPARRRPL